MINDICISSTLSWWMKRNFMPVCILCQLVLATNAHARVIDIIAAKVTQTTYADTIEALGTTRANETVTITTNTTEKIANIHFTDGQTVQKGDILVQLEKSEQEAQLKAASAALEQAKLAYQRAKDLQGTQAVSQATLSERLANLKRQQANVEAIESLIKDLTIKAPFDGVLGLREVSVGALIQPSDKITSLDDMSQIKVDFDVPSMFLAILTPGLKITGFVDAYPKIPFKGEVHSIDTQVDPITRTVQVRALLPNPKQRLKPGLLMNILLENRPRTALLIPEEALIKRGFDNFVYRIENNKEKTIVKWTQIQIGTRKPGVIEVTSGLNNGDIVVIHGVIKLQDNAEVHIKAVEDGSRSINEIIQQDTTQ